MKDVLELSEPQLAPSALSDQPEPQLGAAGR